MFVINANTNLRVNKFNPDILYTFNHLVYK